MLERGKFAFFMESTSLEYQIERNCELTQVGGLLDSKSYGVALARNSRLRAPVSSAIIRLQESGVIAKLKRKWWREERGGGACAAEEKSATGGVRTQIHPCTHTLSATSIPKKKTFFVAGERAWSGQCWWNLPRARAWHPRQRPSRSPRDLLGRLEKEE